jgi:3-phenylpropionate/trans-cinnamate dioxygenase ferredoxin reductase component
MTKTFVVVGANLAGGSAAAALRERGFDGRVMLIGSEAHPPYERPPLSKEYLRGEKAFEKALLHPAEFWPSHDVETRFGVSATALDTADKTLELSDGDRLRYHSLLLATGAKVRRPPIPGLDLPGIYTLRTVEDADAIRAEAGSGRRAVVAGMGFIGSEVAASLRALGTGVVAIDGGAVPLQRVLGDRIGSVLAALHRDHGVMLRSGETIAAFEGDGRVERVKTGSGEAIECDFAVVGLGVEPATELPSAAGITVDNGVVVDEYCRTSAPDVYAAGDVANHAHPLYERRVRVEHWQNARHHGAAAARSMIAHESPYDEVHWFWSDQYDVNLQYAGFHTEWDELIVHGSLEDRDFIAYYVKDGRVLAAVAVNRGRELRAAMPMIKARESVDLDRLRAEAGAEAHLGDS